MMPRRLHPKILLVEGKDERWVLPELLELAGIAWPKGNEPVHIEEQDGVAKLLAPAVIEATLKASGVTAVGIVVDANGDPGARWQQLRARLAPLFPGFPLELPATGTIHATAGQPRIGVWLMPDNVRAGMLETLLLALRGGDEALHTHASAATDQARTLGAPFREAHRAKAELHAWLAWQDPPGQQLHSAVRARQLPPAPVTHGFVAWFKQLFGL
jgi:hypothetical protein